MNPDDFPDPQTQLRTSGFRLLKAEMLSAEKQAVDSLLNVSVELEADAGIADFGGRLLIYDASARCVFKSRFHLVAQLDKGCFALTFSMFSPLHSGLYACSFEFRRGVTEAEGGGEPISLNALFIDFELLPLAQEDGLPEASSSPLAASLYPVSASRTGTQPTRSRPRFPWPVYRPEFSLQEVAEVLDIVVPNGKELTALNNAAVLLTPGSSKRSFTRFKPPFQSQIGEVAEQGVSVAGGVGFMLFGPYMQILPGEYLVTFDGAFAAGNTGQLRFDVSANSGRAILASLVQAAQDEPGFQVELKFVVPEPGFTDLEFRVHGSNAHVSLASIEVESLLERAAKNTFQLERLVRGHLEQLTEQSGPQAAALARLNFKPEDGLMVFIPNRVFTICALVVAFYLHRKYGVEVDVISEGPFDPAIDGGLEKFCGIRRKLVLSEFLAAPLEREICALVTHAENSNPQTLAILEKCEQGGRKLDLQVYADGFRNSANPQHLHQLRRVSRAYFFGSVGYAYRPHEIDPEIIDLAASRRVITRFALAHRLPLPRPGGGGAYAVFCLRYWGLHGYNFSAQAVADSWYATIARHSPRDELIVFKGWGGHQVNHEGFDLLKAKLDAAGYRHVDAGDFLAERGLPAAQAGVSLEYLLFAGYFREAARFFTLDSSLPLILAHLDFFPRPADIVVGVEEAGAMVGDSGFVVVKNNFEQLKRTFASLPDIGPCQVRDESDWLFVLRMV